ncbi:MAG: FtsW/RodA/SpoVE family cell cycle protein [Elusimicrobia bacterium]|nr:FtsW/RodA/SpoVE family cell cycle protein [Elusimicrobiota bacterium]
MGREFISPILVGRTDEARAPLFYRLFGLDTMLLAAALLLVGLGTLVVYAALRGSPNFDLFWARHLAALTIGLSVGLIMIILPTALIAEACPVLYVASLALLSTVLLFGRVIHGSKSWFVMGPVQFQPSELAKFTTILYASYLAVRFRERDPLITIADRLKLVAACALPMILVLAQNDVSSALSFVFILAAYAWSLDLLAGGWIALLGLSGFGAFVFLLGHITAGLSIGELGQVSSFLMGLGFGPGATAGKWLIWALAMLAAAIAVFKLLQGLFVVSPRASWVWPFVVALALGASAGAGYSGWKTLKGYQKNRLISFLFPRADPLGSGYNITQSKIALGSGGFLGKGLLSGSQASLGFLPERHTDFAFASLGETMGFIGTTGALVLFGLLFWRLTRFTELAREEWGKLVALGLLSIWFGEVSINIAYVSGLFPILGIGLPFLSYGGSRLVVNALEMGLLLAVSRGFFVYRGQR